MSDLSAYGSSIQALREQAQSCRVSKVFPVSNCEIPGVGWGPGSRGAKRPRC